MRVFAAGLLAAGLALCAATSPDPPREAATALARKAAREEKDGHVAQAYLHYSEAAALNPRNHKYAGKAEALRTRAARQSPPIVTGGEADPASEHPVVDPFDSLTACEMA